MKKSVLVTGGTGKTGGNVVHCLVKAGYETRCASRSGTGLHGATGVRFDWHDPTTFADAVAGVNAVYMVQPIGSSDPLPIMQPFIEQAMAAGIERFVLLSSSLLEEGGPAMGQVHAYLRQAAPEWAVLRPSWFMENFTIDPHLVSIRLENVIYSATAEGQIPFIAASDIAEVAIRCLVDETPINDGLVLTGPELLSYADVARIIGEARGKPVRHKQLTGDELTARLSNFGIPAEFASMLANLDLAIAGGAEARMTNNVLQVTGRSAVRFVDLADSYANLWNV